MNTVILIWYIGLANYKSSFKGAVGEGARLQWISSILFSFFHTWELDRKLLLLSILTGIIVSEYNICWSSVL